jgi:hypothetical protein
MASSWALDAVILLAAIGAFGALAPWIVKKWGGE